MSPQSIHQMLDHQMHLWKIHRALLDERGEPDVLSRRPVVALSRQLGSCHGEIARAVGARLDLQVHGRTLIDAVARDKGLERRLVEALDERTRSESKVWVSGLLNRRLFSHDEFHLALAKVVRTLAALGGVLFVGRGAGWILEGAERLHVRIVASPETRVANLVRAEDLDEALAWERIQRSDEERAAFVRRLFHADIDDPAAYDLTINTDRVSAPYAANLIESAVQALWRPQEAAVRG